MFAQISIVLLVIFCCATMIQSRRLSYDDSEDLESNYDESLIDILQLIYDHKARNLMEKLEYRSRETSVDELQQFREQILQAHNKYRARHCATPLTLDDELNNAAQQHAEYLVSIGRLEHAKTPGFGENLYGGGSSMPVSIANLGNAATDYWYDEINVYDFSQGGFSSATGHFTQLVWKDSRKLGAGVAFNSDRTKYYVVARYTPSGNYRGQYQENVVPANC